MNDDIPKTTEERRLRDWLQNIVEIYDTASELFANDADVAASMADRARAALAGKAIECMRRGMPEWGESMASDEHVPRRARAIDT